MFDLVNAKCVSKYTFPCPADVEQASDDETARLGCSHFFSDSSYATSAMFAVGKKENFIPIW